MSMNKIIARKYIHNKKKYIWDFPKRRPYSIYRYLENMKNTYSQEEYTFCLPSVAKNLTGILLYERFIKKRLNNTKFCGGVISGHKKILLTRHGIKSLECLDGVCWYLKHIIKTGPLCVFRLRWLLELIKNVKADKYKFSITIKRI
jgi:hypothetical protein